jgi:hypothetical protein
MSRQFRVFLMPSDVESLFAELRAKCSLKLLLGHAPTSTPVEIASPIHSQCFLTTPSGADIRLWYAGDRAEWILHDQSETIEFSGCAFDGSSLADGRFYFHTDKLFGDVIVRHRPEFLGWADKIFRTTKKHLVRSKALDAYLGPEAAQWWRNGGRLVFWLTRKDAHGSEAPDV